MVELVIGNKHTYTDFGLRMLSFHVSSPEAIIEKRQIPGMDGLLDLSEALGEIRYKNRTLTAEFDMEVDSFQSAEERAQSIRNSMHGLVKEIVHNEDNEFYYKGRVSVDIEAINAIFQRVIITADVYPYKLKRTVTQVTGVVSGTKELNCRNSRKSVVPLITTDASIGMTFNGVRYTVNAGTHTIPGMKFTEGDNLVICTGTGNITFEYQEGSL